MIRKISSRIMLTAIMLSLNLPGMAASMASPEENPDWMRGNGLLFIVIAVLLIIFSGLFIYMMMLDKKISKLEKQINHPINE